MPRQSEALAQQGAPVDARTSRDGALALCVLTASIDKGIVIPKSYR